MDKISRRNLLGVTAFLTFAGVRKSFASESLQSILDSAPPGATVKFPKGAIEIYEPLVISKPVALICDLETRLLNKKSNSPVIKVLSGDVLIDGLQIVGFGSSANKRGAISHGDAILIGNRTTAIQNVVIRRIHSQNTGDDGVAVEGGNRKRRNMVSNVSIEKVILTGVGTKSNYHAGIYVHGGDDVSIVDSSISGFGQCILTTALTRRLKIARNVLFNTSKQHGMYLSGATDGVTVSNNTIYDVLGTGIKCSAPNTLIEANTIVRPRIWGINLKADLHNVKVTGNLILDAGNDGIDSGFEKPNRIQENIVISHNRIIGSGDNGINFVHDENDCVYKNITISNNTIQESASNGIRVRWNDISGSLTESITISDNTIFGSGGIPVSIGRSVAAEKQIGTRKVVVARNTMSSCTSTAKPAISLNGVDGVEVLDNLVDGYSPDKISRSIKNSSGKSVKGNIAVDHSSC